MRLPYRPRPAAAILEFAVIGPLALLLVLGLIVGGLGIFRYQEVAFLAREGSRWASVHGAQYAKDTGNAAATATDVYQQVIAPRATSLNPNNITYSVTWSTDNGQYHKATVNGQTVKVANTVTVTVTYQWIPEAFLGGITLSSTSVSVMSY